MVETKLNFLWHTKQFPSALVINSQDIASDFLAIQSFINNIYKDFGGISYENNGDVVTLIKQDGKFITIEQVRSLSRWLYQKPGRLEVKFFVIYEADTLNNSSSNALLKILEEPPTGCYCILLTQRANSLAITIRSRCYKINSYKKAINDMKNYKEFLSVVNSPYSIIFDYCNNLKSEIDTWRIFIDNLFLLFNRWMKFAQNFEEQFFSNEYNIFQHTTSLILIDEKFLQVKKLLRDVDVCNLDYPHIALLIINIIKE